MVVRNVRVPLACVLLWVLAGCSPPPPEGAESVIVVHGLGRTSASMAILEQRLENAGFRVVSFRYPSTSEPMEALVDLLQSEVALCCGTEAETVHFVTHSMGGVLVRSYLHERPNAQELSRAQLFRERSGDFRKQYIEFIEFEIDCPITIISLGPERSQVILR